jgi:hypothetical protein
MDRLLIGLVLVLPVGDAGRAEAYRLQVANLDRDGFVPDFAGPFGTGSGELVMAWRGRALDPDAVPHGMLPLWLGGRGRVVPLGQGDRRDQAGHRRAALGRGGLERQSGGAERMGDRPDPTTRTQKVVHFALPGSPLENGDAPALRSSGPYRVAASPSS